MWGSILPATRSFVPAARSCELATAGTTLHVRSEHEAAGLLGVDGTCDTQVGLIPLA